MFGRKKPSKETFSKTVTTKETSPSLPSLEEGSDLNQMPERQPTMPVKNPVVRPSDYVFNVTRRKPEGTGESKRLLVGRDIRLTGEIASCDKLVVEGEVEADLPSGQSLDISEGGRFKGKAVVETAIIGGDFDGELTVKERLTVKSTGTIRGIIRYHELDVERGAKLIGTLEYINEPSSRNQPYSYSLRSDKIESSGSPLDHGSFYSASKPAE